MDLPLQNRLKKRAHAELASLQDEVVDILYNVALKAVFHGGTCIWRCYGGSRFSEDLDFYLALGAFDAQSLKAALLARGLALDKFKQTQNLMYAKISSGDVQVRLEINLAAMKSPVSRAYEKTDGAFMEVLALSAEGLLAEKFAAYANRKLVRDIYDVFYLSRMAQADKETATRIRGFLKNPFAPVDYKNLRAIVYAGAVPTYAQMLEALRGRFP